MKYHSNIAKLLNEVWILNFEKLSDTQNYQKKIFKLINYKKWKFYSCKKSEDNLWNIKFTTRKLKENLNFEQGKIR